MSKFKKVMVAIIASAGVSCLGGAACSQAAEPDYYKLTFTGSGIDYVLEGEMAGFISGGRVKEGQQVKFKVVAGASTSGEATVLLNGEPIAADEQGVYAFTVSGESSVTVTGVSLLRTVSFTKTESVTDAESGETRIEERRVRYLNESGEEYPESVKVAEGEDFRFKVQKSPYYKEGFMVVNGTEILTADSNGVYTVKNLTGNAQIAVRGVEYEDNFVTLNGMGTVDRGELVGNGSESSPYEIRRPIDLLAMATFVNDDWYSVNGFYQAHYKLMEDIDMEGEQLYVIGDNSNSSALFCGVFDGNGHTIKNFYITDEVVDQESFANEYLPYVGLFGHAAALTTRPAVIKNLNLENGELRLHTAAAKNSNGQTGGLLVGYGIGVEIVGCTVSGRITVESDVTYVALAGGVAGMLQSAYVESATGVISYDASVKGTCASVDISCAGNVYAAGGIVGQLVSADYASIAYVSECYSTGDVSGAMRAGGVVGLLGNYSSVSGCYASGAVRANNPISYNGMQDRKMFCAYAGGVVGYAEADTVIYSCYGGLVSTRVEAASGASFTYSGAVLGAGDPAGTGAVSACAPLQINCIGAASDSAFSALGWSSAVWTDGKLPALKKSAFLTSDGAVVERQYKITVGSAQFTGGYYPVVRWYQGGKMEEYAAEGSARSYGYFFDEALTQRVPYGFCPTADITLYAQTKDYSIVSGTYYISSAAGAYVTLSADGTAFFRNGGLSRTSEYIYDGSKVIIYNSSFASLSLSPQRLNGARFPFKGEFSGDSLTLTGIVTALGEDGNSSEELTLTYSAAKAAQGIKCGAYRCGTSVFVFNENGTGSRISAGGAATPFTYEIENAEVVIYVGADIIFGDLTGGEITDINFVPAVYEADYAVGDDSFAGGWSLAGTSEQIEIELGKQTANGGHFGSAKLYYYGRVIAQREGEYDVTSQGAIKIVNIYIGDERYATLTYDESANVLTGELYSAHYQSFYASATLYRYDALKGDWNASGGDAVKVSFNGKGLYDVPAVPSTVGAQGFLEVHGTVTFTLSGNVKLTGTYSFNGTAGTVTVGKGSDAREYALSFDGQTVTLTDGASSQVITLGR